MEGKRKVDLKDIFKSNEKVIIEGTEGYFECYLKKLNPIERQELNEIAKQLSNDIRKEIIEKEDTQKILSQLNYMTKDELLGLLFQRDDLVSREWILDTIKVENAIVREWVVETKDIKEIFNNEEEAKNRAKELENAILYSREIDKTEELKNNRYNEILSKKRELLERKDEEELKIKFREDLVEQLVSIEVSNRLADYLIYYMVYECKEDGTIGNRYFNSVDDVNLKYLDNEIKKELHNVINKFNSSLSQTQLKNLLTTQ